MSEVAGNQTQIHALAAALKDAGMDVKVWRDQRIYINKLGGDITAYVEMDNPLNNEAEMLWSGCSLKVFTDCEQTTAWRLNRRKQIKHGLMKAIHATGVCGDLPAPSERWEDVIL
jgi:hypothetical protein